MATVQLPPIPPGEQVSTYVWRDWFTKVQAILSGVVEGVLSWTSINFTGSNITDILTRRHTDLQALNSTDYTHLTEANHTDLTDGKSSDLHYHNSDRAFSRTDSGVGSKLYTFYNCGGF